MALGRFLAAPQAFVHFLGIWASGRKTPGREDDRLRHRKCRERWGRFCFKG